MQRLIHVMVPVIALTLVSIHMMVQVNGASFDLTLLHTGDIRGRVLPIDRTQADCSAATSFNGSACYGGLARLSAYIADVRASRNNVVLVDAGNFFYGSLFFSTFSGAAHAEYFTSLAYDAWGLGSNEFFQGTAFLREYINSLGQVIPSPVASNLDVTQDPSLSQTRSDGTDRPLIQSWYVKVVNGRKIGFIGAVLGTLRDISSPGKFVTINPNGTVEASVRNGVRLLQLAHPDCNIIICLATLLPSELSSVIANVDGIDIVVEADNDLYINGKPAQSVSVAGPYPRVTLNANYQKVLTVISGYFGGFIGDLKLSFDEFGNIIDYDGTSNSVELSNIYRQDMTMWSSIQARQQVVLAQNNVVVGRTSTDIFGSAGTVNMTWGCRYGVCNMGHLVGAAFMDYCSDCDIVAFNSGGIRADISASAAGGNITRGAVLKVWPFSNNFATYLVRGSLLLDILKKSIESRAAGGWLQLTGVRMAFNPNFNLPLAQRLIDVQIQSRVTGAWVSFSGDHGAELQSSYFKVAGSNYFINGGDGYAAVYAASSSPPIQVNVIGPLVEEIMFSYLKKLPDASATIPTTDYLRQCSNSTYELVETIADGPIWPNQCNMLRSTGVQDLLRKCVTNIDFCQAYQSVAIYDGKYANASCGTCSGLGVCINRVCSCDAPLLTGAFANIQMISGRDCSTIRSQQQLGSATRTVLYFLCGVTIFIALAASTFYYLKRDTDVVRHSTPVFLHIGNIGAIFGAIACVALIPTPSSSLCAVFTWFANVGFVLLFGAIFCKTWRLYLIFIVSGRKLQPTKVTNARLLIILGVLVLIEMIIQSLSAIIAAPQITVSIAGNSDDDYFWECTSTDAKTAFNAIAIIYKAILVLWGIFIAFEIRDIHREYNESRFLGITMWNLVLTFLIVLPLVMFLTIGGMGSPTSSAIFVIAGNYLLSFTVAGLAVPKFIQVKSGKPDSAVIGSAVAVGKTGGWNDSTLLSEPSPNALGLIHSRHLSHLRALPLRDRGNVARHYKDAAVTLARAIDAILNECDTVNSAKRAVTIALGATGVANGVGAATAPSTGNNSGSNGSNGGVTTTYIAANSPGSDRRSTSPRPIAVPSPRQSPRPSTMALTMTANGMVIGTRSLLGHNGSHGGSGGGNGSNGVGSIGSLGSTTPLPSLPNAPPSPGGGNIPLEQLVTSFHNTAPFSLAGHTNGTGNSNGSNDRSGNNSPTIGASRSPAGGFRAMLLSPARSSSNGNNALIIGNANNTNTNTSMNGNGNGNTNGNALNNTTAMMMMNGNSTGMTIPGDTTATVTATTTVTTLTSSTRAASPRMRSSRSAARASTRL